MATRLAEAIYKINYFIFLSIKKHREKAKNTRKNSKFCLDGNVATLSAAFGIKV